LAIDFARFVTPFAAFDTVLRDGSEILRAEERFFAARFGAARLTPARFFEEARFGELFRADFLALDFLALDFRPPLLRADDLRAEDFRPPDLRPPFFPPLRDDFFAAAMVRAPYRGSVQHYSNFRAQTTTDVMRVLNNATTGRRARTRSSLNVNR
jgi:hypothetical protein